MPLHFDPESGKPYYSTRYVGVIEDSQMFEYYRQVYARPELKPLKAEFVDLSEADLTRVSATGLADLAAMIEDDFTSLGIESLKTAVYSPDDMPFGLGRIYQAWSESSPELVRVFRDKDKALEWLSE